MNRANGAANPVPMAPGPREDGRQAEPRGGPQESLAFREEFEKLALAVQRQMRQDRGGSRAPERGVDVEMVQEDVQQNPREQRPGSGAGGAMPESGPLGALP